MGKHPRLVALSQSGITQREYLENARTAVRSRAPSPTARQVLARAFQAVSSSSPSALALPNLNVLEPGWVSFAEHHSSITHPETTNVVANLALFAGGVNSKIVTLSCGTIPLDNELFPRGVLYEEHAIPLMSNRQRRRPVIAAEPWDMTEARVRLTKGISEHTPDTKTKSDIMDWFDSVADELRGVPRLWQQITLLNARLGESLFADGGIQYIQIPMELVASHILIEWFTLGVDNWVTELLTDTERFSAAVSALDGTDGFFDIPNGRGTVFFWKKAEGALQPCGQETHTQIVRPAAEWVKDLTTEAMVPSAGLAMLVLALLMGIPNFGGLLQYDYLADARDRMLQPAAGLTKTDRDELAKVLDSFYVNFENRPSTRGGLRRLLDPIDWGTLERESELNMRVHTEDCLAWLSSSFRRRF